MRCLLYRFAADERGATAIEYGLIVSLISVVIISSLTEIGSQLNSKFETIASALR